MNSLSLLTPSFLSYSAIFFFSSEVFSLQRDITIPLTSTGPHACFTSDNVFMRRVFINKINEFCSNKKIFNYSEQTYYICDKGNNMSSKEVKISAPQYAADLGITKEAVYKRIKNDDLPGILEVEKWGKEYMFLIRNDYFEILGIDGHKKIKKKKKK